MSKPLYSQPPESVEEMKALLRGIPVEKDNECLMGSGEGTVESLRHLADRKYESSRRYRERTVPGYGAKYSSRSPSPRGRYPVTNGCSSRSLSPRGRRSVRRTLPDGTGIRPNQCIICKKDGCHSSNHQRAAKSFLPDIWEEDFTKRARETAGKEENSTAYILARPW